MTNRIPESEAYLYWDPETIAWYPLILDPSPDFTEQPTHHCPEDGWFIKPVHWQETAPVAREAS